jgi:hypothetical protein
VRQANYPIDVARRAWKVIARKHPAQCLIPNPLNAKERIALNPFVGVERARSEGTTEPASRADAYALAEALARIGHSALGAAALICYEWLQRPENVLAGKIVAGFEDPPIVGVMNVNHRLATNPLRPARLPEGNVILCQFLDI